MITFKKSHESFYHFQYLLCCLLFVFEMTRTLDILLFGASGFTGKHAIPVLFKLTKLNNRHLTWGIAGRSEKKLKEVLLNAEKKIGTSLSDIPIIVANIEDETSLTAMARQTRIVLNCCGPYRFFGEAVVRACVQEGTHHVDVSGEPEYMERMQLNYHKQAQDKGIYVVNSCGLDSIPVDLGTVFLQQNFAGTLNSVVSYMQMWEDGEQLPGTSFNYATWESLVHGVAHAKELGQLRRELFATKLPKCQPKLEPKVDPHKTDLIDGWVCMFHGADRSVVKRSQHYFYEMDRQRPVQIETYFIIKSFMNVVLLVVCGYIFSVLANYELGRQLLLKHPEIFSAGTFSHEPPNEVKLEKSKFCITLYGEGWREKLANPDDQYSTPMDSAIVAKIKGSNPGYGATSVCLVLAAITILTEPHKMPSTGGVYPPGYAFANTSLIEQLNANDVTFEIVHQKDLTAKL